MLTPQESGPVRPGYFTKLARAAHRWGPAPSPAGKGIPGRLLEWNIALGQQPAGDAGLNGIKGSQWEPLSVDKHGTNKLALGVLDDIDPWDGKGSSHHHDDTTIRAITISLPVGKHMIVGRHSQRPKREPKFLRVVRSWCMGGRS
jgi:hypothetical protein